MHHSGNLTKHLHLWGIEKNAEQQCSKINNYMQCNIQQKRTHAHTLTLLDGIISLRTAPYIPFHSRYRCTTDGKWWMINGNRYKEETANPIFPEVIGAIDCDHHPTTNSITWPKRTGYALPNHADNMHPENWACRAHCHTHQFGQSCAINRILFYSGLWFAVGGLCCPKNCTRSHHTLCSLERITAE